MIEVMTSVMTTGQRGGEMQRSDQPLHRRASFGLLVNAKALPADLKRASDQHNLWRGLDLNPRPSGHERRNRGVSVSAVIRGRIRWCRSIAVPRAA
jgi:hypothetical protein